MYVRTLTVLTLAFALVFGASSTPPEPNVGDPLNAAERGLWTAPRECPGQTLIQEAFGGRLRHQDVKALGPQGQVQPSPLGWTLRISWRFAPHTPIRVLHDPDCGALADAFVAIVSLRIRALARSYIAAIPKQAPAPLPAKIEPVSAAPPVTPQTTVPPAQAPYSKATDSPPPERPKSPPSTFRGSLRTAAGIGYGTVPNIDLDLRIGAQWRPRPLWLDLTARYVIPMTQPFSVPMRGRVGLRVYAVSAMLGLCPVVVRREAMVALCAGTEAGIVVGKAEGVDSGSTQIQGYAKLDAGVAVSWPTTSTWRLWTAAKIAAPVARPAFFIDYSGEDPSWRMPAFGAHASIGVDFGHRLIHATSVQNR